MIKGVIFDNGGVIVDDIWGKFIRDLKKKSGKRYAELRPKIGTLTNGAKVGEIPFIDFLDELKKITNDYNKIEKFTNKRCVRQEVLNWIKELKNNYEVAVLSNDFGNFRNENKDWDPEKYFGKNIFYSSEIKMAKPDPDCFRYTLKKIDLRPREVVFIDDKEKNIDAALSLGLNAIKFESLEQVKNNFEEMVFLNGKK